MYVYVCAAVERLFTRLLQINPQNSRCNIMCVVLPSFLQISVSYCVSVYNVFDAAWIVRCEFLQKKEATPPISFRSVLEHSRVELKDKIRVTDELLDELLTRCILIQQNVDHIRVSS